MHFYTSFSVHKCNEVCSGDVKNCFLQLLTISRHRAEKFMCQRHVLGLRLEFLTKQPTSDVWSTWVNVVHLDPSSWNSGYSSLLRFGSGCPVMNIDLFRPRDFFDLALLEQVAMLRVISSKCPHHFSVSSSAVSKRRSLEIGPHHFKSTATSCPSLSGMFAGTKFNKGSARFISLTLRAALGGGMLVIHPLSILHQTK